MPTQESQSENFLQTTWQAPLSSTDLRGSFKFLADRLDAAESRLHVLFDITEAGGIPLNAPSLALQSGFLRKPRLGKVVVVGMDSMAQTLASLASSLAGKEIVFFPTVEEALEYLEGS